MQTASFLLKNAPKGALFKKHSKTSKTFTGSQRSHPKTHTKIAKNRPRAQVVAKCASQICPNPLFFRRTSQKKQRRPPPSRKGPKMMRSHSKPTKDPTERTPNTKNKVPFHIFAQNPLGAYKKKGRNTIGKWRGPRRLSSIIGTLTFCHEETFEPCAGCGTKSRADQGNIFFFFSTILTPGIIFSLTFFFVRT